MNQYTYQFYTMRLATDPELRAQVVETLRAAAKAVTDPHLASKVSTISKSLCDHAREGAPDLCRYCGGAL